MSKKNHPTIVVGLPLLNLTALGILILTWIETESMARPEIPLNIQGALLSAPIESTSRVQETLPPPDLDGILDLAYLSFPDYDPPEIRDSPEALGLETFPPVVQSLQGQTITTRGYLMALDLDDRRVSRFLLTRYPPGCCFGKRPVLDEWIEVSMIESAEMIYAADEVVEVKGVLDIEELLDDEGFAESLYRMKGESVTRPDSQ